MLHIFTFATDESKLIHLKKTAKNHNVEIQYILKKEWNGYYDKIAGIIEVIKHINDNDIVCFIDAYDVLCNNSSEDIINKFIKYDCDLLIGAELNCYPEKYQQLYDIAKNDTNYHYVNSGGYIGYKHAIASMFTYKSINEILNICNIGTDQAYVTEYYLEMKNKISVKLDIYAGIFQNMYFADWKEFNIKNGQIQNKLLSEIPCFIHFNGGSFKNIDEVNIMGSIVENIENSKINNIVLNFTENHQFISDTYFPHPQMKI